MRSYPQEPAHLDESLTAGRLDRAERLARGCLLALEYALPRLRLHHDHADRMRDDVVQLAGDPDSLLGDREPGLLLALPLQALGALRETRRLGPLPPESEADSVGGGKHEPGRHGVFDPGPAREEVDEIGGEEDTPPSAPATSARRRSACAPRE